MGVLAGDGDLRPTEALTVGDNADILALGLQDRPLFDVQLEEGMHLALAHRFVATPADALQLIAECLALGIFAA